jgi:hypothetical protein
MGFESLCATLIALFLGLALCFAGYRLFLTLLPLWGFLFGFALGAQSIQLLFGVGFLETITSWLVGFLVGAAFALLSYLFFAFAVAVTAGSLGYGLGLGFMGLVAVDWNWLVWLVGILAAIAAIAVTFVRDLQKYAIIVATAIGGAGIIVGALMFGYVGMTLDEFFESPIRFAVRDSPLWAIALVVLVALGIVSQVVSNQNYEIEAYENRI